MEEAVPSRVRKLFDPTDEPNFFKCKTCKEVKNGTTTSNLVKHYRTRHYNIFKQHLDNSDEEHIQIQRLKMLHSCVELVTINSQPFNLLSSSGFRSALESKLREFQLAGCALNLSDQHVHEVKEKIRECQKKIEDQIKLETKNEVISLMVDAATRNGRSIFGINVQYRYNGTLRLVTLAMYELKYSHTAAYLGDVVLNVLSRYGIKLEQVLTFTTDNGSNMLAMVKNLERRVFRSSNENELDVEDDNDDIEIYENLDAATLDDLLDSRPEYDQLFANIFKHLKKDMSNRTLFLSSIRCAAHTLQLIVWEALESLEPDDRNLIERCREAAKFLRLPNNKSKMREASLTCKFIPLDCKTRWSSTYLMVSIYISSSSSNFINRIHYFHSSFEKKVAFNLHTIYYYFQFTDSWYFKKRECHQIFRGIRRNLQNFGREVGDFARDWRRIVFAVFNNNGIAKGKLLSNRLLWLLQNH